LAWRNEEIGLGQIAPAQVVTGDVAKVQHGAHAARFLRQEAAVPAQHFSDLSPAEFFLSRAFAACDLG